MPSLETMHINPCEVCGTVCTEALAADVYGVLKMAHKIVELKLGLDIILGQPMLEQVEKAIAGKKVYYFVKFYAEDKNYTVTQLYLEEEIKDTEPSTLQPRASSELQHTNSSAMEIVGTGSIARVEDVVHQKTSNESQFFTPSLKTVLDETSSSTQLKGHTSDDSPAAKRILQFGTIPATLQKNVSMNKADSTLQESKKHEPESPVKESKKKDEA